MFLSVLFIVCFLLSGCGPSKQSRKIIVINSHGFNPPSVNIKVGTLVVWINGDDRSTHRVKSILFNSPDLTANQQFTQVFNAKGVYEYSCGTHSDEVGKIVVE
jgi:plastocyanin